MVKCIFSLGIVDKKIILPFLMSINQVILNLIDFFYERKKVETSNVLDSLAYFIRRNVSYDYTLYIKI